MSKLGKMVQDKVTGMKGIATQVCVWMNGCVQYFIEPKIDEKGNKIGGIWVDDIQIKVLGKGLSETLKISFKVSEGPAGGFRSHP